MTTLVLLPSPLTRASAWGRLPEQLRSRGAKVAVIEPEGDDEPPYALRWIASCALQIGALSQQPVVLIGHSGAGVLLARLGSALRAAHRPVVAYVFLDAGVPRALPGSRLDVWRSEDPTSAAGLDALLEAGGAFPTWTSDDLAEEVPDPTDRQALIDGLRPRGKAFWTEPLPTPTDWPDAPCVYLRTSAAYEGALRAAGARGWPTDTLELGHFPALSGPEATATSLLRLLDRIVPDLVTR